MTRLLRSWRRESRTGRCHHGGCHHGGCHHGGRRHGIRPRGHRWRAQRAIAERRHGAYQSRLGDAPRRRPGAVPP